MRIVRMKSLVETGIKFRDLDLVCLFDVQTEDEMIIKGFRLGRYPASGLHRVLMPRGADRPGHHVVEHTGTGYRNLLTMAVNAYCALAGEPVPSFDNEAA